MKTSRMFPAVIVALATMHVSSMPSQQQSTTTTPRYTTTAKYIGYTEVIAHTRRHTKNPIKLHTHFKHNSGNLRISPQIAKETNMTNSTGIRYKLRKPYPANNGSKIATISISNYRRRTITTTRRPVAKTTTVTTTTKRPRKPTMVRVKTITSIAPARPTKLPIKDTGIRYRNYTKITTIQTKPKLTTPRTIIVIRNTKKPSKDNVKQAYADYNIPIPNPQPEVSSYSPGVSITDSLGEQFVESVIMPSSSSIASSDNIHPEITSHSPPFSINDILSSAQNQLNLNDLPAFPVNPLNSVKLTINPGTASNDDCPTIDLASGVMPSLGQAKQQCPDINLVINSYVQQNTITERVPTVETVEAVDAIGDEEGIVVDAAGVAADPVLAATPVQAAQPAPAVSSGGGGSSGIGFPSFPGFPSLPELPGLPDMRGLLRFLGLAWRLLSPLFGFLNNPFTWLMPGSLMFGSGILLLFSLFPYFLPLFYLTTSRKTNDDVVYYKHHHPTVHHYNGWYWDHETKSWINVLEHLKEKHGGFSGRILRVPELIDQFKDRYGRSRNYMTWKARRKKRPAHQIGETIKVVTNQLMDVNLTSADMVLDTRTPPRVRQQTRREKIEDLIENSHAGIAIPVDEDAILLEEPIKKMHFYKVDKPTTDSGLSTWILLSGHTSSPTSTTKTSKKPNANNSNNNKHDKQNITIVITDATNKIIKPSFKKKLTTTTPSASLTPTLTASTTTKKPTTAGVKTTQTAKPDKTTKLTKVKASILNNALNNKTKPNNLVIPTKRPSSTSTTNITPSDATTPSPKTTQSNVIELVKVSDSNASVNANELPVEAKNEEVELDATTTTANPKKSRRPGNKRKKNKNRRKRPTAADRNDNVNNTKVATTSNKEKPIGTQIYNYLSREVMPTVGVGLVGLMVTAGLASYFLYPFGTLRRSYDVDRKDKDSAYYYRNEYTGGIAEEEAISKVVAGMPANSGNYNNYPSKNNYPASNGLNSNVRYRHVDSVHYPKPQGSVETVQFTPNYNSKPEEVVVQNTYTPQEAYNRHYSEEVMNDNKDDGKQFVVGNVPKEYLDEVTPIAVPEHGPRMLKIRRRRRQIDSSENDIFSNDVSMNFNTISSTTTIKLPDVTTTTKSVHGDTVSKVTTTRKPDTPVRQEAASFLDLFKDILQLKLRMGLELLQNTTQTISRYISRIQKRVDEKTMYRS